jgi:hypothetical protein
LLRKSAVDNVIENLTSFILLTTSAICLFY